jgi:hypothetical protein
MTQQQFSGIWHSTYWFPSNNHDGEDTSEYDLEVFQRGNKLNAESLPSAIGDHMTLNLTLDSRLATGSWLENTSDTGEFAGMVYTGALQLIVSEDGNTLEGKWVGVGRERQEDGAYEPQIYSGRWMMVRKASE